MKRILLNIISFVIVVAGASLLNPKTTKADTGTCCTEFKDHCVIGTHAYDGYYIKSGPCC